MNRTASLICAALLTVATAAGSQEVGQVGLGYAWLNQSGSNDSFASQFNLQSGFFLDELRLNLSPVLGGYDRFEVTASGFGADPWQTAGVKIDWHRVWALRLNYNRRESVFASPSFDLGIHHDRWAITNWTGTLTYDGWRAARVRLDMRDTRRSGQLVFPFYGLAVPYSGRSVLDERVQEVGLSLETKTWPVKVLVEQDYARYLRRSRAEVANGGRPAGQNDGDPLIKVVTPGQDENTVPTTRLAAVYRDDVFEFVGQGLYRRDRLDADRNDYAGFALGGGKVGEAGLVDAVMGGANVNTGLGDLRLGAAVAPFLTVRLRSHYENTTSDMSLTGERLIRMIGPGGSIDLPFAVNDAASLDRKDRNTAAEAELHGGPFALVVNYHNGSREISWRHGSAYPAMDVTRDAEGWGATASFAMAKSFTAEVGWEDGTFEKYVFRTDPESVTRTWARLAVRPLTGLELAGYGRRETVKNPASQSALDGSTDAAGLSATWSNAAGVSASVSADWLKLASDVAILYLAPKQVAGLSRYETDLFTASARVTAPLGDKFKVEGGGLRVEDRGASLPFTSSTYDLRLSFSGPWNTEYSAFGNFFKYDLKNSNDQDYDATRYGIVLRRRF